MKVARIVFGLALILFGAWTVVPPLINPDIEALKMFGVFGALRFWLTELWPHWSLIAIGLLLALPTGERIINLITPTDPDQVQTRAKQAKAKGVPKDAVSIIGRLLLVVAAAVVVHAMTMDVTVYHSGMDIANLPLMAQRQNEFIVAGFVAIIGVMLVLSKRRK